jgi:hypothetical protein
MRAIFKRPMFLLFTTVLGCCWPLAASARDEPRARAATNAANSRSNTATPLTGKERLGRKWMDEQRIDNCNVPVDKRGRTPRPSSCYPARLDRPS